MTRAEADAGVRGTLSGMSNAEILRRELDERKRAEEKAILLAEQARRSFASFFKQAWPIVEPSKTLQWGIFLDAFCEHLEAVHRGQIKNLAVMTPMGTTKTITFMQMFPAWSWVQDPGLRFLCASNDKPLGIQSSIQCRELVQSEWYQRHFPHVKITSDQNLKEWFGTDRRGFRQTAVVEGKVTGKKSDVMLIDDPNDADKVKSKVPRESVISWYDNACHDRVNSFIDSRRVIVAHRSHRNDLIGHCVENHGYEPLVLTEEFEPRRRYFTSIGWTDPRTEEGELLRPDQFGPEQVEKAKVQRGNWRTKHQQDPSDEENAFYKPHYFQHRWRRHPHTPGVVILERDENDRYEFSLSAATLFTTCDAAADAKTSSDHTALLLFAASPRGDLLVLDGFHERLDIPDQPELLARANAKWPGVTAWGIEAVGSNRAMFQFAKKMFLNAVPMNIKGEKLVKAQPAIIRASQGGIWLPEDNAVPGFDVPGLLEELVRFTGQAGGQDDRADCCAMACNMLPTLPTMRGAIGTPKAVSVLSAPRLPKPGTGPRISRAPLAMPRVINVK
jgi:hypothetical protein